MNTISFLEALAMRDTVFVDVRTPLEYSQDHIAGAINIPILLDEERALVGTIYKHESAKKAVDKGIVFFSMRLPEIVERLREFDGKNIIVYCWRGGMRSRAFVSFLSSLNFNMFQLSGGYKSFRHHVRESLYGFEIKPPLLCIYGMTGTGKTDIIKKLAPLSIDLEGLAGHRSSIFGHVGLTPRSQKMFENLLLAELERTANLPYIFIEGESRKVGNINLPDSVYKKMMTCRAVKVSSSMEARVRRIVDEYFDSEDKIMQIEQVLNSNVLSRRLGGKNILCLKECLLKGDYESLVALLLEKYYDPLYMHAEKNLKNAESFYGDNTDEIASILADYAKGIIN